MHRLEKVDQGIIYYDYLEVSPKRLDELRDAGITEVELPFDWRGTQPTPQGPVNEVRLAQVKKILSMLDERGMSAMLVLTDCDDATVDDLADFWVKVIDSMIRRGGVIWPGIMEIDWWTK